MTQDPCVKASERFVVSTNSSLRTPEQDVWVIGGSTVYADTITEADELLLTQVVGDFHCTKFFPPYQLQFCLATKSDDQKDGDTTYRFETWQRLSPKGAGGIEPPQSS